MQCERLHRSRAPEERWKNWLKRDGGKVKGHLLFASHEFRGQELQQFHFESWVWPQSQTGPKSSKEHMREGLYLSGRVSYQRPQSETLERHCLSE